MPRKKVERFGLGIDIGSGMIGVASELGDELSEWYVAWWTPHQFNQPRITMKIIEIVGSDKEIINISVYRNLFQISWGCVILDFC